MVSGKDGANPSGATSKGRHHLQANVIDTEKHTSLTSRYITDCSCKKFYATVGADVNGSMRCIVAESL
jgi:hypothetical protein